MIKFIKKLLIRVFGSPEKKIEYCIDSGFSYEFYHTTGPSPCGKLAFTCIQHPKINNSSKNAILPNKKYPVPHSPVVCGNCGGLIIYKPEERRIKRLVPDPKELKR